jgi:hypothetical protein
MLGVPLARPAESRGGAFRWQQLILACCHAKPNRKSAGSGKRTKGDSAKPARRKQAGKNRHIRR